MTPKYQPLNEYLSTKSGSHIALSFRDIERILGTKLPLSARKHRPWWSNNPTNSVMTKAWLRAGYRTEQVDMERGRLVFRRQPHSGHATRKGHVLRFYGCMKGMITIAENCELTDPADPNWRQSGKRF